MHFVDERSQAYNHSPASRKAVRAATILRAAKAERRKSRVMVSNDIVSHAKDMECSLTCAGVFYFPGLAYSPVLENKNVTFSLSSCAACMRPLASLTSHVHVVLQPLPSKLSSAFFRSYVVAALGTFIPALRSARSDTT